MKNKSNEKWNLQINEIPVNEIETIKCKVNQHGTKGTFSFYLTFHANKRCTERKIDSETLALALLCSIPIIKQGVLFHVVSPKYIPQNLNKLQKSRLKNLVVITDASCSCVITSYYTQRALHKTNKKRKSYWEQLASCSNENFSAVL